MIREKRPDGSTLLTGMTLNDIMLAAHPVGSYYTSDDPTDPATLFGGGTWVRVKGVVVVGLDEADVDFDTVGETGGAKSVNLSHAHSMAHVHSMAPHTHPLFLTGNQYASGTARTATNDATANANARYNTDGSSAGSTGSNLGTTSILQPYTTAYMWKRTA